MRYQSSFAVLAVTLTLLSGCNRGSNQYAAPPPPEVTVASPVKLSVTPFLEKTGETEAKGEVEVRARVTGFIDSVEFEPGQRVKVDDVLYRIERDQYEAEVNSAKAAVAAAEASIAVANAEVNTAQAQLEKASRDLDRERRLMQRSAGSQAQLDAAIAANDEATAAVNAAKASVESAQADKGNAEAMLAQAELDLGYTVVKAPIDGRISKTIVKVGNLVQNGTQLASITNDETVYANFSISDRELLEFVYEEERLNAEAQDMEPSEVGPIPEDTWRNMTVYLRRETDDGFPFTGKLNYVDQKGVEAATGTLGLRAEFDNTGRNLFPGLFVIVRVPATISSDRLVLPELAVSRDQQGSYILAVNDENVVERMPVTVQTHVGGWALLNANALPEDTRIVINGLQRARPGLEVKASEQELNVDSEMILRGGPVMQSASTPDDEPAAN